MQELYKYFQDFYKEDARKHFYVCTMLINNLELMKYLHMLIFFRIIQKKVTFFSKN